MSLPTAGDAPSKTVPALAYHDVAFAYPAPDGVGPCVIDGASLAIAQGAFALLVGGTGSGKTTLLRLAKREVAPVGRTHGVVEVLGRDVSQLDVRSSCELVGYVFQSPDNQIVCDTVWHELAFGLENLGLGQEEMRRRLSEVCIFLGVEGWLHRRCDELSGGQRQVVALAAVLALRPRVLLLDEPTAMLDPVAEQEFLSLLFRANRELGVTVVVATHNPAPMTRFATCAWQLREGRLSEVSVHELSAGDDLGRPDLGVESGQLVRLLDDVWVRYARNEPWVLRGCDLTVRPGQVQALVGGNGSGKSTLLAAAAGMLRCQRGKVRTDMHGCQALLPQQPKALLGCETVQDELMEWSHHFGYDGAAVEDALCRLGFSQMRERHPYDLSGGQQQLLALEKLLLTKPQLLLLDEPTKGLDTSARRTLAARVRALAASGCSVLVATHDMAFVRATAQVVSLLFDGQTGAPEPAQSFFAHSWMWRA